MTQYQNRNIQIYNAINEGKDKLKMYLLSHGLSDDEFSCSLGLSDNEFSCSLILE